MEINLIFLLAQRYYRRIQGVSRITIMQESLLTEPVQTRKRATSVPQSRFWPRLAYLFPSLLNLLKEIIVRDGTLHKDFLFLQRDCVRRHA
jgi:hypothetical protein